MFVLEISLLTRILQKARVILANLFSLLFLKQFVIKTLVLARFSQSIFSSLVNWIMKLLVEGVFCHFCLKLSLFLALVIGFKIQSD